MKRPAFQFYPGDWLRATELRSCSVGARGLWIDMICYMHEGSPYGHLKVNSKVITPLILARMVGEPLESVSSWLSELDDSGVLSRTDDGCIFSRRMVRDEKLRDARASGGKVGGNPKLTHAYNIPGFVYVAHRSGDGWVKIGISQHPAKRAHKLRAQHPGQTIVVLDSAYVNDMGAEESRLHQMFANKASGEWFNLSGDERATLNREIVHLKENHKGNSKENQTPASASASASAIPISTPDGVDVPEGSGTARRAIPDCPHQAIIDLFHEVLPTNPRVMGWNETRRTYLRARWREAAARGKYTTIEDGLAYWRAYLTHVAQSKFLTGQVDGRDGKPPFFAELPWLLRSNNFLAVIEGRYHDEKKKL